MYEKELEMREAIYGPDSENPSILDALMNLGVIRELQRDRSRAVADALKNYRIFPELQRD